LVGDQCSHGLVAAGEAPHDIEHQYVLRNRVPKVAKSISRALHLPAELTHRQIALLKSAELSIELEGVRPSIVDELALESKPGLTRDAAGSPHDVLHIEGDGPKDPKHGDAVEAHPCQVVCLDWRVEEDVVVEGLAAERE
jgi:hypothetical protein